jgi:hypothetical protein
MAADKMHEAMGDDFYKIKVLEQKNHKYRVGLLIKIMFFEKDQAEMAKEFLLQKPSHHADEEDIEVVVDSDY